MLPGSALIILVLSLCRGVSGLLVGCACGFTKLRQAQPHMAQGVQGTNSQVIGKSSIAADACWCLQAIFTALPLSGSSFQASPPVGDVLRPFALLSVGNAADTADQPRTPAWHHSSAACRPVNRGRLHVVG